MRLLDRRITAIDRVVAPRPTRTVLAYARAVVAFGGGEPGSETCEGAAVGLARWLERGRRQPCGPG